jgi:hypothetical protein
MTQPEFSRIVSVARLAPTGAVHEIGANAEERAALARRFGLQSLDRFGAEIRLSREPGGGVRLDGRIEAALVQSCVVTLGPVPAEVGDLFTLIFRPGLDEDEADRLTFETEEDVTFEPLEGDSIDIGEVAAQQLSLVIDPYPRAQGAALGAEPAEETPLDKVRPFEGLASLARKS